MRSNPAQIRFCLLLIAGCLGLSSCTGLNVLRADGFKYVRLGQEMPLPSNKQFAQVGVRDTLLQGGEYSWPALILSYPEGEVWIEADFFGLDRVNRIRVETAEIRLRGQRGLSVGSPVAELRSLHPRWQVIYLADYGVYDVVDPMASAFHYLFQAPEGVPEAPSLRDLPDDAPVIAVVVM